MTDPLSVAECDRAIRAEVSRRLSRQHAVAPVVVTDDSSLSDLGLGSLDLLELVDELETVLKVNPFEGTVAVTEMRTVGDLCAAYRTALVGGLPATDDDLLQSSRKRAEARRRDRTA
jgi:acyl carrier protein